MIDTVTYADKITQFSLNGKTCAYCDKELEISYTQAITNRDMYMKSTECPTCHLRTWTQIWIAADAPGPTIRVTDGFKCERCKKTDAKRITLHKGGLVCDSCRQT